MESVKDSESLFASLNAQSQQQMLRIFINNNELVLAEKKRVKKITGERKKRNLPTVIFSVESKKELKSIIGQAEHTVRVQTFVVYGKSFAALVKRFLSCYQMLEAAGGIVLNEEGKVLMIFRRGKWDLPKGKIDRGETVKQAARREVMEETGIRQLRIRKRIRFHDDHQDGTYHSYWLNGKRVMKKTHWFRMESDDRHALIPQFDEGITEVGWYSIKQVRENLRNSYRSVRGVMEEYFGKEL